MALIEAALPTEVPAGPAEPAASTHRKRLHAPYSRLTINSTECVHSSFTGPAPALAPTDVWFGEMLTLVGESIPMLVLDIKFAGLGSQQSSALGSHSPALNEETEYFWAQEGWKSYYRKIFGILIEELATVHLCLVSPA